MGILSLTRSHGFVVFLGAAVLFLAAQIQIPLQPVPITLQTMGVMILGLLFEKKAAMQAVLLYITLGIVGLPVFAGFSTLFTVGARAGYLVGFVLAVWAMTSARERLSLLGLNLLGTVIIYVCGIAWLSVFLGFEQAILVGLMPFLFSGAIKVFLLAGAVRYIRGM